MQIMNQNSIFLVEPMKPYTQLHISSTYFSDYITVIHNHWT